MGFDFCVDLGRLLLCSRRHGKSFHTDLFLYDCIYSTILVQALIITALQLTSRFFKPPFSYEFLQCE